MSDTGSERHCVRGPVGNASVGASDKSEPPHVKYTIVRAGRAWTRRPADAESPSALDREADRGVHAGGAGEGFALGASQSVVTSASDISSRQRPASLIGRDTGRAMSQE